MTLHTTTRPSASLQACVTLRDLYLTTQIGTYGPQDVVPDAHVLDLTLWLSPNWMLIHQDGMDHVFDYDPLVREIDRLAADGHYDTQERLVTRIVHACAAFTEIEALDIALRKSPVRQGTGDLGVRLSMDASTLNAMRSRTRTTAGWTLEADARAMTKTWVMPNFDAAVALFNQIAQLAKSQDHHPEVWSSYKELRVRLWTHDTAGLTEKDFTLAQAIDQLSITA